MKDPNHTPRYLMLGQVLADNRLPFLPFHGGAYDGSCSSDPRHHFIHHQHVYGAFPANDAHCPSNSRA